MLGRCLKLRLGLVLGKQRFSSVFFKLLRVACTMHVRLIRNKRKKTDFTVGNLQGHIIVDIDKDLEMFECVDRYL